MTTRRSIQLIAFAIAALVNVSMLAGVDHLASVRHVPADLAKAVTDTPPAEG